MEIIYASAIARAVETTGVQPAWAEERLTRLNKFKAAVQDALKRKGIVVESF